VLAEAEHSCSKDNIDMCIHIFYRLAIPCGRSIK